MISSTLWSGSLWMMRTLEAIPNCLQMRNMVCNNICLLFQTTELQLMIPKAIWCQDVVLTCISDEYEHPYYVVLITRQVYQITVV